VITIRPMTGYEVAPLAEALQLSPHSIRRRWSETLAALRDTLVADYDGRVAGIVSISPLQDVPGCLHLFSLDVAPPLRNRGIGSTLIAAVESEARTRSLSGVYLEVSVSNVNARRLYERLGYTADGPPFPISYIRYEEPGNRQEVTDTRVRLVKRFESR
jgi:ribosomal protein S18 acetylase RimI-like enzyme